MTVHTTPSAAAQSALPATALEGVLTGAATDVRRQKLNLRKLLLAGVAVVALAGAGWYGYDYWTVGQYLVSTDDAYVKADNTTIAPKVSGYLDRVLVADNEHVKAGQVLARIDDRDFRVALDQARADVQAANATISSKEAQLDVQQAVIKAARATLDVDQANLTFAAQDNKRYTDLAASGSGSAPERAAGCNRASRRRGQRSSATTPTSLRRLKQIDLLKAEIEQAKAAAARADAVQHQAELNLGYTNVVSPIDGVVGNRSLRIGQFVQAGTQLMSIVPAEGAYVVANFKETQLTACAGGTGRRYRGRHVPGPNRARPCRFHRARKWPGIRAAAAGQRHRQLHQGGAAYPGQDRARRRAWPRDRAAARHVRDPDHCNTFDRADRNTAVTPKAKLVSGGSCHVKQPLTFDASNTGRDA